MFSCASMDLLSTTSARARALLKTIERRLAGVEFASIYDSNGSRLCENSVGQCFWGSSPLGASEDAEPVAVESPTFGVTSIAMSFTQPRSGPARTNPLTSLPETCRSSWAAIQLTFV